MLHNPGWQLNGPAFPHCWLLFFILPVILDFSFLPAGFVLFLLPPTLVLSPTISFGWLRLTFNLYFSTFFSGKVNTLTMKDLSTIFSTIYSHGPWSFFAILKMFIAFIWIAFVVKTAKNTTSYIYKEDTDRLFKLGDNFSSQSEPHSARQFFIVL